MTAYVSGEYNTRIIYHYTSYFTIQNWLYFHKHYLQYCKNIHTNYYCTHI